MKQTDRVVLHPIRMRMIQLIAYQKTMTVAAIAAAMPDIPRSTIYHHVAVLHDCGVLQIVQEEKIRGTYERAYALRAAPAAEDAAGQEQAACGMLLKLFSDFSSYFRAEDARPVDDRLFLSVNALLLNDAEFDEMKAALFSLVQGYLNREPDAGRKLRTLSIVSSPSMDGAAAQEGKP